jgi:LacI family transcriptional regulator
MATIRDVARVADVSIATVSATLNGTARVSQKRAQRVWDAIRAVGYTPHEIARSLRLGHTRSIGLIVGDISNPFFTSLAKAVEASASAAGYMVILANSDESPEKELNLIKLLLEQRVAGILLAPSGHDAEYRSALSAIVRVPVVLVDRQLPGTAYDAVVVDNRGAARMVTDYLVRLKHTRIAIVIGRQHIWTTAQRVMGYREGLRAAGLKRDPDLERQADSRIETAYEATQRLLGMADPPTALFAANNLMLLGALNAILDMRLDCPGRISLAGVDDFPWSSAMRPRLTTVSQPIGEMGTRAVEQLLDRIARRTAIRRLSVKTITLEPRFMIRESCASPEVDARLAVRPRAVRIKRTSKRAGGPK